MCGTQGTIGLLSALSSEQRMSSHSLVVNREALAEDHLPARLVGRDREEGRFGRCLAPATRGRKPLNVWIYGATGTGKTLLARYVLRELNDTHMVESVVIHCWEHRTFYKVLDALTERLKILHAEQQDTAFKLDRLRRHLKDGPLIVILDDIDSAAPKDRNAIICGLCSCGQIGLVCISHKKDTFFLLESGTQSRLSPQFVECAKYPTEEMLQILRGRSEASLCPDCCSGTTFRTIVQHARGDARMAIEMLRSAAEWAAEERARQILPEHLEEVWHGRNEGRAECLLSSLTDDHRMLYDMIKRKRTISSAELRRQYLTSCGKSRRTPIAPRTHTKYLRRLILGGLVDSARGRGGGNVRILSVKEGPDVA